MSRTSLLSLCALLAACGARSPLRGEELDVPALDGTSLDAPITEVTTIDVTPPCTSSRDCDDRIACTRDSCDPSTRRCVFTPLDSRCNDGLFCNGAERCVLGVGCQNVPLRCDDGVACTNDRCEELSGGCVAVPDDSLCPLSHGCDVRSGCFARALAHGPDGLYDVRLPSGETTRRAGLPIGLTDLALRPDGQLFAVGRNVLYQLDPGGNPVAQFVPAGDFTALDAAPDGTLYAGAGTELFVLRASNAPPERFASFPMGLEASGDLAFFQGRLLATARTDPMSLDTLVEFDLTSRAVRSIGPIGFTCVWGLAAFGGTLYGLTCEGLVLSLDPVTGRGTQLSRTPTRFFGATAR